MDTQTELTAAALSVFTESKSDAPDQAAQFLKSLAHKDRLKLLCVLLDNELTVAEIEAEVGASQSAVSQHLSRLRAEGILSSRREGRQIHYRIADPMVRNLIELLYLRFCAAD